MLVIHQAHDYTHVKAARGYRWAGPEGDANKALLRVGQDLSLDDATHRLDPDRLVATRGGVTRRLRTALCRYSWTVPIYRSLRRVYHLGRVDVRPGSQ